MSRAASAESSRTALLGRFRLLAGVLVFGGMFAGGCKSSGVTMDSLQAENEQLRARNKEIEDALNQCETGRAALQTENDTLRSQITTGGGGATGDQNTGLEEFGDVDIRGSEIAVAVAGDVLFDSGQATLKQSAKSTLDQIAGVINSRYGGNEIRIAGHTDSDPLVKTKAKWSTNENLSAQRALAVEEYLSSRGVAKDRMYIAGYGPAKPRGDKKSSRRVEIVIIGAGGS